MTTPLNQANRFRLLPLVWMSILGGCSSLAPYVPPALPSATAFTTGTAPTQTLSVTDLNDQTQEFVEGQTDAQWWRSLRSPVLDAFVSGALHEDLGVAIARARTLDRGACRRRAEAFGWRAAAERFMAFLLSDTGRRILRAAHFDALDSARFVGSDVPEAVRR